MPRSALSRSDLSRTGASRSGASRPALSRSGLSRGASACLRATVIAAVLLSPVRTASGADPASSEVVVHHGIDVSHHQGEVDWGEVKADGMVFAFAKATEGDDFVDPMFDRHWTAMKEAGLVRGAYHFFDPNVDAAVQAENFIATVTLSPGDLPPVLDIEITRGVSREGIDEDIRLWLEKVETAYGVKPILYSDPKFIAEYLGSQFSEHPLWLAEYTGEPPEPPEGWEAWTFWQYSQHGQIKGITGTVDKSQFRGTVADWHRLRRLDNSGAENPEE